MKQYHWNDIPDHIMKFLKREAVERETSVKELLVSIVEAYIKLVGSED